MVWVGLSFDRFVMRHPCCGGVTDRGESEKDPG